MPDDNPPASDRLLAPAEKTAVQSSLSMTSAQVDEMQATLSDTSSRSKNVRLALIKLAALALAQS